MARATATVLAVLVAAGTAKAAHSTSAAQDRVFQAKVALRRDVVTNRKVAWRWQDRAGIERSPTRLLERHASLDYLHHLVHMWWKRAYHAMRVHRQRVTATPTYSSVDWDAIAYCESSGNWSTDTGNGYHGGLQFSHDTWISAGGGRYASDANLASREQQIAIASTLALSNWPRCGAYG